MREKNIFNSKYKSGTGIAYAACAANASMFSAMICFPPCYTPRRGPICIKKK